MPFFGRAFLLHMKNNIQIRRSKKDDIDFILEMYDDLANYHHKLDKFYRSSRQHKSAKARKDNIGQKLRSRNWLTLIAELNGKKIGFFQSAIEKGKGYSIAQKQGNMYNAFILGKYRKLGAGRLMFEETLRWFKKNKIKHVIITADIRNQGALKAYKKFGFSDFQKKMRLDL